MYIFLCVILYVKTKGVTIMSNEVLEQYAEANRNRFLPAKANDDITSVAVYGEDGSEAVMINGNAYPIMDTYFELSLVQPGALRFNDKLKPEYVGKFWKKLSEEPSDEDIVDQLYLIPICVLNYSRSKFAKFDGNKTSTPLCRSRDGMYPETGELTPDAPQCAKLVNNRLVPLCPSAKKSASGEKAQCTLTVNVAFLDIQEGIPLFMRMRGTGMQAFIDLDKNMARARNVARIRHRNLDDYVVLLKGKHEGTYARLLASYVKAPEEFGDMSTYRTLAAHYRAKLFNRAPQEEEPIDVEEATVIEEKADAETFDI